MNRGILQVTREAVHALLSGGWRMTAGLPANVQIVGMNYDVWRDCLVVVLEHESFPPVPEGCELPVMGMLFGERVADESATHILETVAHDATSTV